MATFNLLQVCHTTGSLLRLTLRIRWYGQEIDAAAGGSVIALSSLYIGAIRQYNLLINCAMLSRML